MKTLPVVAGLLGAACLAWGACTVLVTLGNIRVVDALVRRGLGHTPTSRIPDDATVWPGHDYGVRPSSTIGLERATNPFLRCRDLPEFLALKRDWPTVKQQLGLK